MLFYEPEFVFIFLPVTLAGFYLTGRFHSGLSMGWLLLASLLFYTLGNAASIGLLIASICGNFYLGRFMDSRSLTAAWKKRLLIAGIMANLGTLTYYKCLASFSVSLLEQGSRFMDILIPLGLSFFTLQQVAYLIDRFNGRIGQTSFFRYALFISFFPQLIAGPIVRYQEMIPQLNRDSLTRFRYENLTVGITVFVLGALKKLLIADQLSHVSDALFASAATGGDIMLVDSWIGAMSFYFQLYFDFSAYSDMAYGISKMFGITLPLNFNSPYKSLSLSQLFLRWHMTLYRFLGDYLMRPLIRWIKKILPGPPRTATRVAVCLSTVFTFSLSGIWHGTSLNFFFWGLLNGVVISAGYLYRELFGRPLVFKTPGKKVMGFAATFIVCLCASVIFRSQSLEQAFVIFKAMAGVNGISLPRFLEPFLTGTKAFGIQFKGVFSSLNVDNKAYWVCFFLGTSGVVFLGPNVERLVDSLSHIHKKAVLKYSVPGMRIFTVTVSFFMATATVLFVSLMIDLGSVATNSFIYFYF